MTTYIIQAISQFKIKGTLDSVKASKEYQGRLTVVILDEENNYKKIGNVRWISEK